MSDKLYQGVIHQMQGVINRMIGIADETGTVMSCSDITRIGDVVPEVIECIEDALVHKTEKYTCQSIWDSVTPEHIVFVEGTDELAEKYTGLAAVAFNNIKQYYDEKFDRSNFVKNIILDNILPGDIYLKARELRFNNESSRVVLLTRVAKNNDVSAFDVIQNLFKDKSKDFTININETDIALVKEVSHDITTQDLEELARSIVETLESDYYVKTMVGIGTKVTGVKDLARSFKEAQVSLEVSKVFDTESSIVSYENLGIARLVYQLPTTLCEMFLREVFKRGSIDNLDHETLFTIQKFFENNLNVSETSRKLFVHRNTLVYRLEKTKKLTGLDLREFDDAIVFKVALMVKKYLDANPAKF